MFFYKAFYTVQNTVTITRNKVLITKHYVTIMQKQFKAVMILKTTVTFPRNKVLVTNHCKAV